MTPSPGQIDGAALMQRVQQLAAVSEHPEHLTRTYLTPEHRQAGDLLALWMQQAGMSTRRDAVGNICGRYEASQPGAPALLLGSHFDTVRNAGRFDGSLGVLAAIACVDELNRHRKRLPFAVEAIAFADEEGVRFNATLIGSRAVAGTLNPVLLELTDSSGISFHQALIDYGLDPTGMRTAARQSHELLAYVELHIEQGPILLTENIPVGIVSAIAGANRLNVSVTGNPGHAGTVPMSLRQDALTAAAEAVLLVESLCRDNADLIGTVGKLSIANAAVNVIPGAVSFTVDLRAGSDPARQNALAALQAGLNAIAQRRKVSIGIEHTHSADSASCAPWLMTQLCESIERAGLPVRQLVSGAGHDAMSLPDVTDIAMLFVRCGNAGISHHPTEIVSAEDAELSTRVLYDFVSRFRPRA